MTGKTEEQSPFLDRERWWFELKNWVALLSGWPVSPGHTLIVPKRVVSKVRELTVPERLEMAMVISNVQDALEESLSMKSFNIGINEGPDAGQTVPHMHIHVIPRVIGDVVDPIGGVRNVIPERGDYIKLREAGEPCIGTQASAIHDLLRGRWYRS